MGAVEACEGTSPEGSEVAVEIAEGSIEQFAPRDHDQIDGGLCGLLHQPEDLSNQSFSPVSQDGSADLSAGDDSEPRRPRGGRSRDDGEVPTVGPAADVEHALELATAADPPCRRQGMGWH